MELVDTRSGDWFSPSVVVVLTASHPGGADKESGLHFMAGNQSSGFFRELS